jgi:thiamine-phosphate pyrophosphorylase
MLPKLQYITDSPQLAEKACKAGVRWIQARIKNTDLQTWTAVADDIVKICKTNGVLCTINDSIEIALKIQADGVHLGKKDMPVEEARKMIGNKQMIVGGSANTAEDVMEYARLKVDYMGLGPLRNTATKKDLNPILGVQGITDIVKKTRMHGMIIPPVYGIGGIQMEDITGLQSAGVYGIAVSGAISRAMDMNSTVQQFMTALHEKGIKL